MLSLGHLALISGPLIVIRVLRVLRIARIFKLARYSIGLRAFGETMRKSAAELSMLGMFLLTGIMLFSTAIYFFERDEPNSKFYSIPAAWWWCEWGEGGPDVSAVSCCRRGDHDDGGVSAVP